MTQAANESADAQVTVNGVGAAASATQRGFPRPTSRLLALAWALSAFALLAAFLPYLLPVWQVVVVLLGGALIFDAASLWKTRLPMLTREMPHTFAIGRWHEVAIHLAYDGLRALDIELFDLHPGVTDVTGMPCVARLLPKTNMRFAWKIRFRERGDFTFAGTHLRFAGPLGLLHTTVTLGEPVSVRVYPDFAAVARYTLLATDNRLSQIGIRRRQQRGDGLEFRQLRDYRPGDALRQIDSKATSRLRKLVSREYQEERDQQVVFLLDGGFRMRSHDDGISHFDAALNAMLLLASVVQRQGDATGVLTFACDPRWHAPAKGRDTLRGLMNTLYDLQPTERTPDFRQLAIACSAKIRKRSLLVLMTNVRDEDVDDLVAMAKQLGEKHLVLVATLREQVLDELAAGIGAENTSDTDSAVRSAAALAFLAEREQALMKMQRAGLLVLDATPEDLPARLVNRYLDIKRSGRL